MPVLTRTYRRNGIIRPGKGVQVPDQVTKLADLEDMPKTYVGQGGKTVKVKTNETGLEFV